MPLLYWLLVLFLCVVVAVGVYVHDGVRNPAMLILGAVLAAFCLPVVQLVASLFTTLAVLIFYPEKSRPLTRIGRITLWSFLGTLLGLLAMAGCVGIIVISSRIN